MSGSKTSGPAALLFFYPLLLYLLFSSSSPLSLLKSQITLSVLAISLEKSLPVYMCHFAILKK